MVLNERAYDSTSFPDIYSMVEGRGGIQRTLRTRCSSSPTVPASSWPNSRTVLISARSVR